MVKSPKLISSPPDDRVFQEGYEFGNNGYPAITHIAIADAMGR